MDRQHDGDSNCENCETNYLREYEESWKSQDKADNPNADPYAARHEQVMAESRSKAEAPQNLLRTGLGGRSVLGRFHHALNPQPYSVIDRSGLRYQLSVVSVRDARCAAAPEPADN